MIRSDEMGQRRRMLSPDKQALLTRHLQKALASGSGRQQIPRMHQATEAPVSFAQERLWFLHQLAPESVAYYRPANLRLTGPLDVSALEQSLNEIVRRHAVLRTSFPRINGRPLQRVAPALTLPLGFLDLSAYPQAEREDETVRIAAAELRHLFDLEKGPLVRARLLRLAEQEHILLLTMHHIAFDGWSQDVLRQELASLYQAFSSGQPSPLTDLPIQYTDFARWQRQWLTGKVLQHQLDFWRRQMAGAPAVLNLPTDHPRPVVMDDRGCRQTVVWDPSMSRALRELGRREGTTLFMTLLAAFQLLLSRYTGEEDVVVGCPIAGRNRTELEGLIGFFVNTLALRTDLSGNPTFQELLGRVRKVTLAAYDHQDLPFEKLVKELKPERILSHSPVFQVLFQLRNLPNEVVEIPLFA